MLLTRTVLLACSAALAALLVGCDDGTSGFPLGGAQGKASATAATPRAVTTRPSGVPPMTTDTTTTTQAAAPGEQPMVAAAIDRTFQVYMNALLNHDLVALHDATCPHLRQTEVGFELNGNYVSKWVEQPYEIPSGADYVLVQAQVALRNPRSGASAGTVVYSWYVERDESQNYWVCGFLS